MKHLSDKAIRKYMQIAIAAGVNGNSCYSRKIGSVIVDPEINRIVSIGVNGPPAGMPEMDSYEYIHDCLWDLLDATEQNRLTNYIKDAANSSNKPIKQIVAESLDGCKTCPRKLLSYKSGEHLDRCLCAHSECNAFINALRPTNGCIIICACPLPCQDCCKHIINGGIKEVVCFYSKTGDYSPQSRWMLQKAHIDIEERDPDTLNVVVKTQNKDSIDAICHKA